MSVSSHVIVELAAAVILGAAVTLGLVRLLRPKRKTAAEIERLRRLDINRRGRITSGQIVEMVEPEPAKPGPRLVVYKYEVAGVTYEAAQDVSALPAVVSLLRRSPGLIISLKFDPGRPTNSIVACEEWCGVPYDEPSAAPPGALTSQEKLEVEPKPR